jgi:hypothetical protein
MHLSDGDRERLRRLADRGRLSGNSWQWAHFDR